MKKALLLIALPYIFLSCTKQQGEETSLSISEASLRSHVETLASDDFQGRKPFTEGEVKTINYLQDRFKEYGLEPGNGDSYFQDVPWWR